ncbi:MAG TPA: class F sortase [Micromonosporaceae bacterium]
MTVPLFARRAVVVRTRWGRAANAAHPVWERSAIVTGPPPPPARFPGRRRRTDPIARGAGLGAGGLALIGLFAVGVGLGELHGPPAPAAGSARVATVPAAKPIGRSEPVTITIRAIGVRAGVEPVGATADGSIGTPPVDRTDLTGWYRYGPAPGQSGAAVIVGHVDGPHGPSVFYRLGALKPGAVIEVSRRDHRVAVFRVDSVERFAKTSFPADRIFSGNGGARLRLITCGGRWVGGATGYADNIVVFATLTGTHR